jgi:hypothetical protein
VIEREKRYNDLRARGFYFESDQIFDDFLNEIEELSKQHNTPEINYYHAFEQKLMDIENMKGVPTVGAVLIKVFCIEEPGKDSTEQYKITKIKVTPIEKLMEHKNSRFS